MSGDSTPRKRGNKRRKKDVGNVHVEHATAKMKASFDEDDGAPPLAPGDERIHVHKDISTGGGVVAKIIFFILFLGLLGTAAVVILEYRGTSDVDIPTEESRFGSLFAGWVDENIEKHDVSEEEEGHEEDHDEHSGEAEEVEGSEEDHEEEHDDLEEMLSRGIPGVTESGEEAEGEEDEGSKEEEDEGIEEEEGEEGVSGEVEGEEEGGDEEEGEEGETEGLHKEPLPTLPDAEMDLKAEKVENKILKSKTESVEKLVQQKEPLVERSKTESVSKNVEEEASTRKVDAAIPKEPLDKVEERLVKEFSKETPVKNKTDEKKVAAEESVQLPSHKPPSIEKAKEEASTRKVDAAIPKEPREKVEAKIAKEFSKETTVKSKTEEEKLAKEFLKETPFKSETEEDRVTSEESSPSIKHSKIESVIPSSKEERIKAHEMKPVDLVEDNVIEKSEPSLSISQESLEKRKSDELKHKSDEGITHKIIAERNVNEVEIDKHKTSPSLDDASLKKPTVQSTIASTTDDCREEKKKISSERLEKQREVIPETKESPIAREKIETPAKPASLVLEEKKPPQITKGEKASSTPELDELKSHAPIKIQTDDRKDRVDRNFVSEEKLQRIDDLPMHEKKSQPSKLASPINDKKKVDETSSVNLLNENFDEGNDITDQLSKREKVATHSKPLETVSSVLDRDKRTVEIPSTPNNLRKENEDSSLLNSNEIKKTKEVKKSPANEETVKVSSESSDAAGLSQPTKHMQKDDVLSTKPKEELKTDQTVKEKSTPVFKESLKESQNIIPKKDETIQPKTSREATSAKNKDDTERKEDPTVNVINDVKETAFSGVKSIEKKGVIDESSERVDASLIDQKIKAEVSQKVPQSDENVREKLVTISHGKIPSKKEEEEDEGIEEGEEEEGGEEEGGEEEGGEEGEAEEEGDEGVGEEEESSGVAFKFGVGVAIVVIAHVTLVKKWSGGVEVPKEEVTESKAEDLSDEGEEDEEEEELEEEVVYKSSGIPTLVEAVPLPPMKVESKPEDDGFSWGDEEDLPKSLREELKEQQDDEGGWDWDITPSEGTGGRIVTKAEEEEMEEEEEDEEEEEEEEEEEAEEEEEDEIVHIKNVPIAGQRKAEASKVVYADDDDEEEEEEEEEEDDEPAVPLSQKGRSTGAQSEPIISEPVYEKASITNDEDFVIRQELDEAEVEIDRDPAIAVAKFSAILRQHPYSPRAFYGRARAIDRLAAKQQSNHLLGEAIDAYISLLLLPTSVTTSSGTKNAKPVHVPDDLYKAAGEECIGRIRFRGHHHKAVQVHQLLEKKFPSEPRYPIQLAVTYLMENRLQDAKEVLQGVLKQWPDSGSALVHMGFVLKATAGKIKEEERIKQLEMAADYLKRGIASGEEGTTDGRFFFTLGDTLVRLHRREEAEQVYEDGTKRGLFLSKYQRSLYNVDHLTAKPWWTLEETTYSSFFRILEDNWKIVRDEGLALLGQGSSKKTFKDEAEDLRDVGEWKQLDLFAQGRKNQANCIKAPKTCELVSQFPAATSCTRGQIKFSVMMPGTHVWPHCGPTNCRLRSHLGLVVPSGVTIRVANHAPRTWKPGKFFIFDDSFEHEVWHNGTSARLVLIVDVWHPELTARERKSLPAI